MALLDDFGMVEASPEGSAVKHRGVEVCNGLFGVRKKWVESADGVCRQVLRLICNLTPTNALQRHYAGEASTMGYPIFWTQLVLLDGEVMLLASEDQVGSFHCYALPPIWRPYLSLIAGTSFLDRLEPLDCEAHRRLIENHPQTPVDPAYNMRLGKPLHFQELGEARTWHSIYVDNFDAGFGQPSPSQEVLRDAHDQAGLRRALSLCGPG
eukprot:19755-Amphidinium_carterae.1